MALLPNQTSQASETREVCDSTYDPDDSSLPLHFGDAPQWPTVLPQKARDHVLRNRRGGMAAPDAPCAHTPTIHIVGVAWRHMTCRLHIRFRFFRETNIFLFHLE